MPLIPREAPPPKDSLDDAELIPEATAGWWSLLTFGWITPLLSLGYVRPLEAPDLYKLQDHRSSAVIADKILTSFQRRREEAEAYNVRLAKGEITPGWRALWWSLRGNRSSRERQWRETDGKKKASLALALNDSVKWWFWTGGFMKLVADVTTVLSPLVVKVGLSLSSQHAKCANRSQALINFATESYR